MSYQPDIEGLRALAVLLVVGSHAGIPGFSGGYDMDDAVCPQGICHAAINGQPVYRDAQHLDAGFVSGLSELLVVRIGIAGPRGAGEAK